MLHHLRGLFGVSHRKLRLFACACCRRVWHHLTDPRSRAAVEVAERHADGRATKEELEQAGSAAYAAIVALLGVTSPPNRQDYPINLPDAVWRTTEISPSLADFRNTVRLVAGRTSVPGDGEGLKPQADLLRDIVGTPEPFRRVRFDRRWPLHNDRAARRLALTIYKESRFDLLPILGDALEDAGCAEADILDHCRGPGPHVRGCWVVDLVLGFS
jgi:hypothetical protein